jgi:hypothetical protein
MYNASERKDIRRAEKAAAISARERVEFIVAAMTTKQGRSWFYEFLVSCHIFNDPFTGNALLEAYSKGERNIGLKVYNDIVTNCPRDFVLMMQEASIKDLTDERRSEYRDSTDARGASDEYTGGPDSGWDDPESGTAE